MHNEFNPLIPTIEDLILWIGPLVIGAWVEGDMVKWASHTGYLRGYAAARGWDESKIETFILNIS